MGISTQLALHSRRKVQFARGASFLDAPVLGSPGALHAQRHVAIASSMCAPRTSACRRAHILADPPIGHRALVYADSLWRLRPSID